MKPQKLFSVLYLICIFLHLALSHSKRQGFSSVDDAREINMRKLSPKNNRNPKPPNSNVKYLRSSRTLNDAAATRRLVDMLDNALGQLIVYIKDTNNGKIPLPDMSTSYISGSGFFSVTVVFVAKQGSFSNLTTMYRKSEPIIRRRGNKLELVCSLGPEIAQVEYDKINVAYGYMSMDGTLAANLSPLTLTGQISADYSRKPCVMKLDQLKVTQMGPISTVVSGMGMFSGSIQSAVENYIENSYDTLRNMIIVQTSKIIRARLPHFKCEAYRPYLNLL